MSTDIERLAARIGDSLGPDSANMPPWLWRPLLRLLARGESVSVDDLAAATGRTADDVRHGLAGLADTEYDEHGRVIGHGITLRPTPHRFTVDGRATRPVTDRPRPWHLWRRSEVLERNPRGGVGLGRWCS